MFYIYIKHIHIMLVLYMDKNAYGKALKIHVEYTILLIKSFCYKYSIDISFYIVYTELFYIISILIF